MFPSKPIEHVAFIREVAGAENVVVFVHGILGTPHHFAAMMEKVPENWSIYNILLEGHGGSVEDFADAGMKKWKNQVHRLILDLSTRYEAIYFAAHSMGTLFAVDEAIKNDKIRKLFLLNMPMKVGLKPRAVTNSLKIIFCRIAPDDEDVLGMMSACSIKTDRKIWKYIRWVPNYLALFAEIRKTRGKIKNISVPCCVFQSGKDELVSKHAVKYLKDNPRIVIEELKNSGHFSYEKTDFERINNEFEKFLREE